MRLQKQRDAITAAINSFLLKWEKERITTGALLTYHAKDRDSVLGRWHAASAATDALLQAGQREYTKYSANPKADYVASIAAEEQIFSVALDN